jgi:hypothetical protein
MENAIKTDNAIKQALAVFLAPIAILGLVFTMFTASAFADGTTQQGASGNQGLAAQTTSISTEVRPWCGWTALTAANASITLIPAEDEDTVYDGDAIDLEAIGQAFAIRVGPAGDPVATGSEFAALGVDNCSWFDDDQVNGVAVTTKLAGIGDTPAHGFAGVSNATGATSADTSMNFEAGSEIGEAFVINNAAVSCTDFSFIGSPFTVTDATSATTGASVVTMPASSTTTNNFCSWTSSYAITIPAGLKPLFGGSTYTFTGPTITNTMVYSRVVAAP